jgi:hypothetical protein
MTLAQASDLGPDGEEPVSEGLVSTRPETEGPGVCRALSDCCRCFCLAVLRPADLHDVALDLVVGGFVVRADLGGMADLAAQMALDLGLFVVLLLGQCSSSWNLRRARLFGASPV